MEATSQRRSPYQGLIPYEADDALFFFGREKETRLIAANLFASPLTLLYGASGVGKSSILRAGVINHLRARGDVLVVEFHTWQSQPLGDLQASIAEAVASGQDVPPTDSTSLAEYLAACTAQIDRRLMVILDQFEEYFLYHPQDDAFAQEFPAAVMQADAPVSFLIAIREDALAKLDRFEGRIPILFDNYLRIEHLDRKAARAAIVEPIRQYNHLHAQDAEQFAIEPKLVEAILQQVETGQVILGEAGRGVVKGQAVDAHIETPYLQLVMTRLWDEELRVGSHILQRETMDRLGGAERIIRTHLDAVMSTLLPEEQEIAANVFHYLVTPSGTKIAHTVSDLAEYAQLPQMQLSLVLEKLCRGDVRILRPVAPPPDQPDKPRYETFHDVLAVAILDWRARHVQEQERAEAIKRDAARQLELEQARAQAREQQHRADEQAKSAGRLRRLVAALVVVTLVALGAFALALANWRLSTAAQKKAEEQTRLSFSRELAAAAINNLDADPERSALLALRAASETYAINKTVTGEAEAALRRALRALRVVRTLAGHSAGVYGVAFSPDGRHLATASIDKTAKVWEVTSGQEVHTLAGHADLVYGVAFSPDGRHLATASWDKTAKVWEVTSGQEVRTLAGHTDEVWGIAYSPDGRFLATASWDRTVNVHALKIEDLMTLVRRRITRSLRTEECQKYLHEPQGCPLPATALRHVVEGNNLARAGEVDNAVASFRNALKLDPALGFAAVTEARLVAAEFLVEKGQRLAKAGNADGAITSFQKALELDPTLRLASEAETRWLAAEFLVKKGQRLAKAGDIDGAIASFQIALAHNPSLVFDRQAGAGKLPTEILVEEGKELVRQGKVREAMIAYAGAERLNPALQIPAASWNSLCWFASLWGYAADVVLNACELAVASDLENWHIRDSRGVARAMTGNIEGAIEDFMAFIRGTDNVEMKSQRQRWVDALYAGEKNPITPEDIELMFKQ